MPLQAIMPQFSRGITTAMGNAMEGFREPGRVAEGILNRIEREDREAQRQKERQQDVDFRQKQLDTQSEQWQKSYDLQEQQAKRAQQDQDRKLLGEQRLGEYASRLAGGLTRGEMGAAQAAKVNAAVEQMAARGMSPEQIQKEVQPLLKFSTPKTTAEKIAYIKGAGFESPDYDASKLLDYQQKILSPLEAQLRDEQRMAFDLQRDKARMAHDEKLAAQKTEKEPTISMYKLTPQGVVTETVPASMMKEYVGMGYNPGKFGYAPQGAGGKYSDVKSVYSSPELTGIAAKLGPKDSDRLMKPLGEIQTRYKGIITPGELTNIGMTSITDRGWWGDNSVNQQLMKNQIRDAILSSPKNTESEAQVDKAVTSIMNKYW